MARPRTQRGLTIIEFMVALAAAVVVLGALDGVVALALQAQSGGRKANELVYQGQFAMERMVAKARATAPKTLVTPALPNSTGNWFAPTMYCLKGGNRLVETVDSDTSCTGAKVIADNVVAFSVQPGTTDPLHGPVAVFSLTLQAGGAPITLTTGARLGRDLP